MRARALTLMMEFFNQASAYGASRDAYRWRLVPLAATIDCSEPEDLPAIKYRFVDFGVDFSLFVFGRLFFCYYTGTDREFVFFSDN